MTSCGLCYAKNIVRGSLHKNFNPFDSGLERESTSATSCFLTATFSTRDFFLSALRLRALLTKRSPNAMLEDNLVKHNESSMEKKTKIKMAAKKKKNH